MVKKYSINIIKIICKYSQSNYLQFNINIFDIYLCSYEDINKLATYSNIPFTFFEKHIDKVDWSNLSYNTNIPFVFFEKHLDKVNWIRFIRKYKYSVYIF